MEGHLLAACNSLMSFFFLGWPASYGACGAHILWGKREITIKKKSGGSDKCYEKEEEGIESTRVEGETFIWSG